MTSFEDLKTTVLRNKLLGMGRRKIGAPLGFLGRDADAYADALVVPHSARSANGMVRPGSCPRQR
jgi:hypothetical protein